MADTVDSNAAKISELEKCLTKTTAESTAQIKIIDARTIDILNLVQEVKVDITKSLTVSQELAIRNAQNVIRWESYERDKARFEEEDKELGRRIDGVEDLARNNQITLAKSLALGGGGGAVALAAFELIKFIASKI